MNNKCYKLKKYIYKNPIFQNTVDATYIINLENNGRLDHIMNQLSEYHPTKIVYICFYLNENHFAYSKQLGRVQFQIPSRILKCPLKSRLTCFINKFL